MLAKAVFTKNRMALKGQFLHNACNKLQVFAQANRRLATHQAKLNLAQKRDLVWLAS
jgi:hypothetical protein